MVLYMQYSRIVDGDTEAVYTEVCNSQQAALMFKRVRWDSHDDTRYTKSTLSWRGEEAKSLVRAQVISHLEWIKKGGKKGRKKREEKKIGRGVTGKICALHISCMKPGRKQVARNSFQANLSLQALLRTST